MQSRALLIEHGRLELDDSPSAVIGRYLERWGPAQSGGTAVIADDMPRFGKGDAKIRRVTLMDLAGNELTAVHLGQPFRVRLLIEAFEPIPQAVFEIGVNGADGDRILTAPEHRWRAPTDRTAPRGSTNWRRRSASRMLPGEYSLTLAVHRRSGVTLDFLEQALGFSVLNAAETGGDHYPWPVVRGDGTA